MRLSIIWALAIAMVASRLLTARARRTINDNPESLPDVQCWDNLTRTENLVVVVTANDVASRAQAYGLDITFFATSSPGQNVCKSQLFKNFPLAPWRQTTLTARQGAGKDAGQSWSYMWFGDEKVPTVDTNGCFQRPLACGTRYTFTASYFQRYYDNILLKKDADALPIGRDVFEVLKYPSATGFLDKYTPPENSTRVCTTLACGTPDQETPAEGAANRCQPLTSNVQVSSSGRAITVRITLTPGVAGNGHPACNQAAVSVFVWQKGASPGDVVCSFGWTGTVTSVTATEITVGNVDSSIRGWTDFDWIGDLRECARQPRSCGSTWRVLTNTEQIGNGSPDPSAKPPPVLITTTIDCSGDYPPPARAADLPTTATEILTLSGKCVDIPFGQLQKTELALQQWTCNSSPAQKFEFIDMGDSWYQIQQLGGLVWDVPKGSTAKGTQVNQFTNKNGDNQKWGFYKSPSGKYTIRPKYATWLCLDISFASSADGARVQVMNCHNHPSQLFSLVSRISV